MMQHLKDAVADVVVFVLAFTVSTGACTSKVVTCGDSARQAQEARK